MCCSCLLIKGIFLVTFPTPPLRIWNIQRPPLLWLHWLLFVFKSCFYLAHASTVSNPSLPIFIFYFYNYGQAFIKLYYMLLCFSKALSFWIFLSYLLFVRQKISKTLLGTYYLFIHLSIVAFFLFLQLFCLFPPHFLLLYSQL